MLNMLGEKKNLDNLTTYLPNELVLKIDGAKTKNFYFTVDKN